MSQKLLQSTIPPSGVLNKYKKNIGKINPLFALVHDSDVQCAGDTLQQSNTTNHLFSTLYIDIRYVISLSKYVLRYILYNVKHRFTFYFYMHIYKVTDY